jgi:sulfur carrier protein
MSSEPITVNGKPLDLAQPATVQSVLIAMEAVGKRVAVELNGEIVPRSAHAQTLVKAGDKLEIVVAVGGG